jgi:hypothetical protein
MTDFITSVLSGTKDKALLNHYFSCLHYEGKTRFLTLEDDRALRLIEINVIRKRLGFKGAMSK